MRPRREHLAAVVATLLTACASRVETGTPFEVLEVIDASGPALRATGPHPFGTPDGERPYAFSIVDGKGTGERVLFEMAPSERFGASWSLVESREGEQCRVEHRRLDEQGNVVLLAAVESDDQAISLFQPPMIVTRAAIEPGETERQEVGVRIVDMNDPRRVREQGRATHVIEHAGSRLVRLPSGEAEVACISARFTADLRMAKVDNETLLYVTSDGRIAAIERSEKVQVLGIPARNERRVLVSETVSGIDSPDAEP